MQIKRKKEGNCRNTTRMKLTSNQKYIANGSNNAILTFYGEKEHKERPTNKPSIGTTEPLPRVEGVLEGCERISVWRVWPDPIPIGRRLSDRDGLLQGAERAAQPPQHPRQHSIGTAEPLPHVEGVLEGCERISVWRVWPVPVGHLLSTRDGYRRRPCDAKKRVNGPPKLKHETIDTLVCLAKVEASIGPAESLPGVTNGYPYSVAIAQKMSVCDAVLHGGIGTSGDKGRTSGTTRHRLLCPWTIPINLQRS